MDALTAVLVEHGYLVLFIWVFLNQAGLPIPAAPYVVAAGALAGLGELNPGLLVVITVVATLPADLLWYEIGRRRGSTLLRQLCRISLEPDSCVRDTENVFARYGAGSLVLAKFVPAVETVAPPLAGILRMRRGRFLAFDILGTLLWAGVFVGLGFALHEQIEAVTRYAAELGVGLLVIVTAVLGLYLLFKFVRRQRFIRELRVARITPEELKEKLDAGEEIEVVDLRHSIDFEVEPNTIPGAIHIPVEELDERHDEIARDREVVLYCT
jgi:membrane protein DedA with SNARE-associated domain